MSSNVSVLRTYAGAVLPTCSPDAWALQTGFADAANAACTFMATSIRFNQRVNINVDVSLTAARSLDLKMEYPGEFIKSYKSNAATLNARYLL